MTIASPRLNWRDRQYGKINGQQLEDVLATFSAHWDEKALYSRTNGSEEVFRRITKLAAIPSWVNFYQHSLLEMLAMFVSLTGTADAMQQAAASSDPYAAVADVVASISDEPPGHPAALPLAMAFIANLEAVARYSRTINDMLAALRDRGDIEALGQALSIDSAIITLPVCQALLKYGQLTGDPSFAEDLFRAVKGPHKKRLVYPKLRWAEYLLRDRGVFDVCTQDEIYELVVVHLKLYGDDREHKDAKKSLFMLFRKWWKEAGIQNPSFSWSAT
ncbi:MAG TPA: hypothetical protein VF730_03840 [Terracidiphilus sp.]